MAVANVEYACLNNKILLRWDILYGERCTHMLATEWSKFKATNAEMGRKIAQNFPKASLALADIHTGIDKIIFQQISKIPYKQGFGRLCNGFVTSSTSLRSSCQCLYQPGVLSDTKPYTMMHLLPSSIRAETPTVCVRYGLYSKIVNIIRHGA